MKELTKILVCFFMLGFAGITLRKSAAEGGAQMEETTTKKYWWQLAPPQMRHKPIGQNVTLYAYIFYDMTYKNTLNKQKESESSTAASEIDPMTEYFHELFHEVETYFHNQSIMINITVRSVSQHNFTLEPPDAVFDANATLKKLTEHGKTLGQPKDTIFYYFVWNGSKAQSVENEDHGVQARSDAHAQTNGTFCSDSTSGVVIRRPPGGMTEWMTSATTLFVFNSTHFIAFTKDDWDRMTETFSKCPKPSPTPPAC